MRKGQVFPMIELLGASGAPVFGVAGTHSMKLLREISRAGLEKQYHPAGTELSAGFMSTGYSRSKRALSFCLVTPGPGFLISGAAMLEASMKGTPVVFVSTQIDTKVKGKNGKALHEYPGQGKAASGIIENAFFPSTPKEVDSDAAAAVTASISVPFKPSYIEIPTNCLVEYEGDPQKSVPPPIPFPVPDNNSLNHALEKIRLAEKPVILAGFGTSTPGCGNQISSFAEKIGAPVITTISGKGFIDERHYLSAGVYRTPVGGALLSGADLLISLGASFSMMSTGNRKAPFPENVVNVNTDLSPPDIGRCRFTHVRSTVVDFIKSAAPVMEPADMGYEGELEKLKKLDREGAGKIFPLEMDYMEAFEEVLGQDFLLFTDPTILSYWIRYYARSTGEGKYFYPSGSNSLGFSLPAALGALSNGKGRAIVVTGDGNFPYFAGDLAIASKAGHDVTIVLVNDGGYGVLRKWRRWGRVPPLGVDLPAPDFRKVCDSYGIEYNISNRPEDLVKAIVDKKGRGICLVELRENFSPPWRLV